MRGWTDIHHHLLWGIDDGPRTFGETCKMICKAVDEGVGCIVATPHTRIGATQKEQSLYQRRLKEAQEYVYARSLPLKILPGAEIFYDSMTTSMLTRSTVPRLGGGWYALVEFHPKVSLEWIRWAAIHLANSGASMVLAHAERYRCLWLGKHLERLKEECHIQIQINADIILNPRNMLMRRWVNLGIMNGWFDLVASDAHDSTVRPCNLGKCAAFIEKEWGKETAHRLCGKTAEEILRLPQMDAKG